MNIVNFGNVKLRIIEKNELSLHRINNQYLFVGKKKHDI